MFEKSKGRYLTRGVNNEIPLALQVFMWNRIDELPEKGITCKCLTFQLQSQDCRKLYTDRNNRSIVWSI